MPTTSHHRSFNRDPEEFAEVNVTTVPTPVSANSGGERACRSWTQPSKFGWVRGGTVASTRNVTRAPRQKPSKQRVADGESSSAASSGSRLNDRDEQHRGDRDKQRKRIA